MLSSITLLEAMLLAMLIGAAVLRPSWVVRATQPFAAALDRLSRFRVASIVLCAALPLAVRLLLMPTLGVRAPKTQDEFAHLLQAETFARGRLTNPAPDLPRHFETMHVSVTPTYFSKYPPGQAAILAVGQRLMGHPWWGAWLSVGLMCAAICWMLQRWLPPRWALFGGLLVAAKLGIFSYWMNSYWGGALPAAAGALVLGAARGLLDTRRVGPPSPIDTMLMVAGGVVLANSRPFEGFLLCAVVGGLVIVALVRTRTTPRDAGLRVILPGLLVLLPSAALMGRYNAAVTGRATQLPYSVNSAQYRMAGQFLFSAPRPDRRYRHEHLARFYQQERATQLSKRSLSNVPRHVGGFAMKTWLFFIAPVLTLSFLALPRVLRDRRTRPLLIAAAVVCAGLLANAFFIPHYAAPMAGALSALLIQGLRHLNTWHWHGALVGAALVRGIPLVVLLTLAGRCATSPTALASAGEYPLTWYWTDPGGTEREWILSTFDERPGRHLILVKYDETVPPHTEWVYNGSDLQTQLVLWARSMSHEQNVELLRRFPDRTPWLMEVTGQGNEIWPYSSDRVRARP